MFGRKFWGGVALTALSVAANGGAAFAQSTGSQEFEEEIVVTGTRVTPTIGGVITNENVPKARASIGEEYIATQSAGQSALDLINLIPGVNFTNNDSYGSSGGNIRIRSFDGNRISLTFDGMPLNDTGNYAIFSNQLLDSELLGGVQVNMGSTDVDSPTASATGGTINYFLRRPGDELSLAYSLAAGQNNYERGFLGVESGPIGPFATNLLLAGSLQEYDKWRGEGQLEKRQINGRVYQPIGENGDFVSVAFHYNENRNNNYRALSLADYRQFGRDREFDVVCVRPTPGAGAQTDPDCTNFFGRQVNPSNTGNIRGKSRFTLSDSLTLTVDPTFQYVLADGGGQFGRIFENPAANLTDAPSRILPGNAGVSRDLNGDGDVLDRVAFFTPSVTNTRRYGVTSSLIWDVAEDHRIRFAYTNDYGRHRQTGEYTFLNADGTTTNVFGGKDGQGARVFNADNYHLRTRDRFSIATLNQLSVEYRGEFMQDRLTLVAGLRAPYFERELNQYCYTQINTSTVLCSSLTPTTTGATAGFVRFDFNRDGDTADSGENVDYLRPYKRDFEYDKILPNIGVSFRLADEHQIFSSYVQGLSAPRTDQLYTEDRNLVEPEETQAFDIGYRYYGARYQGQFAVFLNSYKDRIQTAFDPDSGLNIDRSIGDVDVQGAEASLGGQIFEGFNLYANATYLKAELQSDLFVSRAAGADGVLRTADDVLGFLPTKGKQLTETPEWTAGVRGSYEFGPFAIGLEGKFVDTRFITDVNDQEVDAYTVFDLDFSFDLEEALGVKDSVFQININNLFDEDYLGSLGSTSNAFATTYRGVTTAASTFTPTHQPGAPQTIVVSFRNRF
ncbi:MAG: TonB-dependent receptor [Hyphomonadaceae bacterium]|nr:TonB-dependent receptor [Hyphomonadaceae bacterium]